MVLSAQERPHQTEPRNALKQTSDTRFATHVRRLRRDRTEQGPTEPHAGRGTFLLSFGGAGGGSYRVAVDAGPITTENGFPCRTLVVCLFDTHFL